MGRGKIVISGPYDTSGSAGVDKYGNDHYGTQLVTNGPFYFKQNTKAQLAIKSPFVRPPISDLRVLF